MVSVFENIVSLNFGDREWFFVVVFIIFLPVTASVFRLILFVLLPKFLVRKWFMKNYHDESKKINKRKMMEEKKRMRKNRGKNADF